MEFRILGPLEARVDGRPLTLGGVRQRSLLAVLLLNANEVVSSDRLIDELWGAGAPAGAANALQAHVSQLRKTLGARRDRVATRRPGYVIRVEDGELDLHRFEARRAEARQAVLSGDPAAAAEKLRAALALWRGAPLADLAGDRCVMTEAPRLEELRLGALEERLESDLALGRHDDLVGELEALVAQEPLRERLRGQLMLALYRAGRQAEALDVYRETRRALVDELGIEPSRGLQELERAILVQDASLDLDVQDAAAARRATSREREETHAPREGRARTGFVGRSPELRELLAMFEDAVVGRGGLVLLSGEPGIGKTRLADELCARAARRGASALWGRCWEAGGAPAYWPWIQALRAHVRSQEAERLATELGPEASPLVHLLPELRALLPDLEPAALPEGEGARFHLFDAATSFLRRVARARPLVLVLDDLHAADESSLLLLQFLSGELGDMRALVIATYRDVEPDRNQPLAAMALELGREPLAVRLPLRGLAEAEVSRFVELTAGVLPPPSVTTAIHRETEGNPLFVGEIVRLLAAEGRLDRPTDEASFRVSVPSGVREVIGRRLAVLSPGCRAALSQASVLGREFRLDVLGRLTEQEPDALAELLDEAGAAGVLAEPLGSPRPLRFAHALIRETLYEELLPSQRMRLHRRAGEALEAICGAEPDAHLAELAHHYLEGAGGEEATKAVAFARRAAQHAAHLLAFEEAGRLYTMALEAMDLSSSAAGSERCELLLALGDAQAMAGALPEAKETFRRAAELARRFGMPDALARAALGYGGRFVWTRAGLDGELVPLLEDALGALATDDSPLRARLLARLSGAIRDQPQHERRLPLSLEGLEMARRLGDNSTLAYALDARHMAVWSPDTIDERIGAADDMIALARGTGDAEAELLAHDYRLYAFLELGDLPAAKAELSATVGAAARLQQPGYWWKVTAVQTMLALFEGRFDEAERIGALALEHGRRSTHGQVAENTHALHVFGLRAARGGLADCDSTIRRLAAADPTYPTLRCVLASLLCELDRMDECRSILETLASEGFHKILYGCQWLFDLTLLAPVAARLEDAERARVMYELLAPYSNRNAVGAPELATGCVAHSLGLLAATLSRFDDAERHFQHAIVRNAEMRARPWTAHAQHDFARMLADSGEHERAAELAEQALAAYSELGMETWARRAAPIAAGLSRARP